MNLLEKQQQREQQAYEIKTAGYYRSLKKQGASDSPAIVPVIRRLLGSVETEVANWLNAVDDPHRRGVRKGTLARTLNDLNADPAELAVLTLRVALRSVQRNAPYGSACVALGGYVEEHLAWASATRNPENKAYVRAVSKSLKKSTSEHHSRAVVRHVLRKRGEALNWDDTMRAKVGVTLVERMLEATKHFTVVKVGRLKNMRKFLRMGDELAEALMGEHEAAILLKPFHLPMCIEPRPWTDINDGGYESPQIKLEIMKQFAGGQKAAMGVSSAGEVYRAVNKLQRTAWRVNADIFFLMRRCWTRGDQVGKLPPQDNMPLPAQPWAPGTEPTPQALTEWKRAATGVHEDNARLVSKRLAMHSKLAQAGVLSKDERFYFVYTMDWRGRLYPCGGDLTPQSDDAGRALLEFAEGKPIGDAGFYWLAVQLANTYGYDKCSNDERVKWVLDNEGGITLSALEPMSSKWPRMWTEADKPWSFLAACMEWTAARAAGPEFITHLPVAQDGSANGLQHFAALMRDQSSAEAVNLVPADAPADIYQRVADRVKDLLGDVWHGEHDDEDAMSDRGMLADWWSRYAGDWRGLVKRPVMTVPYGVTMYGIRDQLVTEMVKRHGPDDWMPRCAFLAEIVYRAIGDVVAAASTCMGWLREVATAANAADRAVEWVTPCGLPVVQEYHKYAGESVKVYVGGQQKQIQIARATNRRNERKAIGGLSPNFIHSLDAAHLMKTVNLTTATSLAMVHDSYATLAPDVPELSASLRQAFVDLHKRPILEDFAASAPYPLPALPERGDFDIESVLGARYFFA